MTVTDLKAQDNLHDAMMQLGENARAAAQALALAKRNVKNAALYKAAAAIRTSAADIQAANAVDIAESKTKGATSAFLDRLMLNEDRIESMAKGLDDIAKLEDPIGSRNFGACEQLVVADTVELGLGRVGVETQTSELERAERLLERLGEGAANRHDLTD